MTKENSDAGTAPGGARKSAGRRHMKKCSMDDFSKHEIIIGPTLLGMSLPVPEQIEPQIPHPIVNEAQDGRIVIIEGAHRLADQLQRQGACVVQNQESGELFAVVRYTDGSVRRWSSQGWQSRIGKDIMPTPYDEYKKSADKLLAAAQALSQTKARPDGPGVLALPGLLAKLQAAADDLAAVKAEHESK